MRRTASAAVILCSLVPATASANHRHSMRTGNGNCVVLAKQGGEAAVQLPAASFNNTSEQPTTANPHPLHVHVHRGQPGTDNAIGVLGTASDPCQSQGTYLNAP